MCIRDRQNTVANCGDYCLHFDGKTINFMGFNLEFVAICISVPGENHVCNRLIYSSELMDKISMIITESAAVNTGKHSYAVSLLIKEMPQTPTLVPMSTACFGQVSKNIYWK